MSTVQELLGLARQRPLQLLTLAGLLAMLAGISCSRKLCVLDPDIWWHLRVGDWIVQHHSFPRTGILSRTAADRSWVAYSWGYEILLSRAHAWFGLVGVGMFGVLLTLAVGYTVYWMLRRLSGRFWLACILATVACYSFLSNVMPRPVFFSIILFTVALTLMLEASRTGRVQRLLWLPPLFLLWANTHIQFVYGLFVLGLLLATTLLQRPAAYLGITRDHLLRPTLPAQMLVVIFAACTIATCIGPYSFQLYKVIYAYSNAKFTYGVIRELQPIDFRHYSNYLQLLVAGAGFAAVGWQKKVDPFKLALLTVASIVAFRTLRDSWFICIPAVACLADRAGQLEEHPRDTLKELAGLATLVGVFVFLLARNTNFNTPGLVDAISNEFPVNAVNFLRDNPRPGPLYNTLDWGGFLTWYLPTCPVAIDGRNDLYGDELDQQFYRIQMGDRSYITDPYLNEARLVLLQKQAPLAANLMSEPRFALIYQDRIAVIFVRR